MALYLVRHQHTKDHCPAQDPYAGARLLNHVTRSNGRRHGVEIQGEAVVQAEHTLYFIVEAHDEDRVRRFMHPFETAGSLDIYTASTCARVVASGGCAAATPVNGFGPALDPEEACRQAIESGLLVHRAHPLNGETSIPALLGGTVMPNARFYIRNHFHTPHLSADLFRLKVGGLVERPTSFSLNDLLKMPSHSHIVTLECAGNARTLYDPPVEGEKWNFGAVSTAEWTGVPLAEVLDRAGPRNDAREVLFRGADGGTLAGNAAPIRFERSLQLDHARGVDVLLAYAMNGEPLPVQHGYPVRLIVPGWYAVASVKWLTDIELIERPFTGYYQADKYWFEWIRDGLTVREPVTLQRVRSLITEPAADQEVPCGPLTIRGVAWSGAAPIERVQVCVDGRVWHEARLVTDRKRDSWQWWELTTNVPQPRTITIRARATDLAGRTQPERPEWNRLGYGNNGIHEVPVRVVKGSDPFFC
jgi:DMSO/TMAO reductase YedYZ molybdopterin-dependent catalytic subunit